MTRFSRMLFLSFLAILFIVPKTGFSAEQKGQPETKSSDDGSSPLFDANFNEAPTYIKSNSLTLFSTKRYLEYQGNVEVLHDGMRLTCDRLEAYYTETNEIETLFAYDNVFITKGENIRARSEKATYEAASETLVLTDNPEIQQEGSVLTADLVRIYLEEDRSEAEGEVRVKLINTEEQGAAAQPRKGAPQRKKRNPIG